MKIKQRGFSLIEVMAGAAVLAVTICISLLAFINCMFLNEASSNLFIAANDAQYVLEQIKALPYDEIPNYAPPNFNNLTQEAVNIVRSESPNGRLRTITVGVSWQERQDQRSISFSTRIAR